MLKTDIQTYIHITRQASKECKQTFCPEVRRRKSLSSWISPSLTPGKKIEKEN